jgi:hypothetical protein
MEKIPTQKPVSLFPSFLDDATSHPTDETLGYFIKLPNKVDQVTA